MNRVSVACCCQIIHAQRSNVEIGWANDGTYVRRIKSSSLTIQKKRKKKGNYIWDRQASNWSVASLIWANVPGGHSFRQTP